jgi:hypothetical protein
MFLWVFELITIPEYPSHFEHFCINLLLDFLLPIIEEDVLCLWSNFAIQWISITQVYHLISLHNEFKINLSISLVSISSLFFVKN